MMRFLSAVSFCVSLLILTSCARMAPPAEVKNYGVRGGSSAGVIQVYKGDNLYRLSQLYKVPVRDLIEENNLTPPYSLTIGQRLQIPSPRVYTTKAGDSYSSIARMYDLSVTELVRLNNSSPPHTLQAGQSIYLSKSRNEAKAQEKKRVAVSKPVTSKPVTSGQKPQSAQTPQASQAPQAVQAPQTPSRQTVQTAKNKSAINTPPARSGSKFSWPVQGKVLSSYGPKTGGLFNDGVNIGAPQGTAVRVAENGVVAYVGDNLKGFGNLVLVKHDGGYITAYAHLHKVLVERGAVLKKGQSLGTVGRTGSVSTPQLHFEIRKNGKPVNPSNYLL